MLSDTWTVNAVIRRSHVEMKTLLEMGVKVTRVKSCKKKNLHFYISLDFECKWVLK